MISQNTRLWALTLLPLTYGLAACSDEVADPLPPALVQFADAPMSECPEGGRLVISGIDENRDGTLEGEEIETSIAVCNGETGEQGVPGTNALVRSTVEPEGDNCDRGGIRIDVGGDDDEDGTLDDGEIDQTTYACDGPDGQDGLRTLVRTFEVGQPQCEEFGVRIEYGLDANENGTLDDAEVTSTEVLCQGGVGEETLVDVEAEPAGANCPVGGVRVRSGVDQNGDLVLDEAEVEEVAYVCDPVRALVRVETSTSCTNGGSVIQTGGDVNQNGALDESEVTETREVCSGDDAGRSLVITTPEPAGANCAAGGQQVEIGFDDNDDGVLQPAEVNSTSYVCNGERGADGTGGNAVRVTTLAVGSTECPNGGTLVETGPDTNGNGNLDDTEVTNSTASCNGASTTTLVDVVDIAPGGACGTEGGQRIWTGVDDDGDGVLDVTERDASTDVCDTTTGTGVPFVILTASLPGSFRTLDYDETIEAFGGTAGGYSWQILGVAPPGLTIDASGTPSTSISGTLTATGTYAFQVEVTDTFGATATQDFTIVVEEPPCAPGVAGVFGTGLSTTGLPGDLDDGYGIATDTSTSGFVYISDNSPAELWKLAKDGSSSEDLTLLAALSSLEVGYDVRFDGDDLYVLDDSSSSTSNRIQRISTDGGQTFSYQDMATFPSTGNPDDFRGIAFDGTTIYVITQGSSDTEIWSVDTSATLPATAALEATFTTIDGCTGLDLDDDYFYTGCTGPDQILRIDRVTFDVETLTTDIDTSSTFNSARVQDTNGDGLADVLWFGGFDDARYVCDPGGALPAFTGSFGVDEDADYGLDIDNVNGVIYRFDDSPEELFSYQ